MEPPSLMPCLFWCVQVQRGRFIEEVPGFQQHMNPLSRHDGPLFGPGDVSGASGQPDNIIGIFDGLVVLGELP